MDLDDEEPPTLVDVGEEEVVTDSKPLKVPITIVTGKSYSSQTPHLADAWDRVSRSRKDNIDELYSE